MSRKKLLFKAAFLFVLLAGSVAYSVPKALDGIIGEIPPDAEPSLLEASTLFANARVTDNPERSYTGCITAIDGIMKREVSPQTRLRCHYYLAFSHFMNNDYAAAHTQASELLVLALRLYPDNGLVKYTSSLVENIREGEIDSLDDVNISLAAQNQSEAARLGEELKRAEAGK
jgi:hypothetical protein